MSQSHGYQLTPFGIIPIGQPIPSQLDGEVAPSVVPRAAIELPAPESTRAIQSVSSPHVQARFDAGKPLTGKGLMAVAKARVKELDRLLRQVPALEAERASLQRLIDAARIPKRRRLRAVNGPTHQ